MKFILRTLAVTAIMVLATDAGLGAMPMQHAPAVGVPRAAVPATRVLPTVSRPRAFQVKPPPATAAQGGAISGTGIKPHPSALVALGGAETGKGTARVSGTTLGPKKH